MAWTQKGSLIQGSNPPLYAVDSNSKMQLGYRNGISGDGLVLAINANYGIRPPNTFLNQVPILMKQFVNNNWVPYGNIVHGSDEGYIYLDGSPDIISLSYNGMTVAFGCPGFFVGTGGAGAVFIYKNISGVWTKTGSLYGGAEDSQFGSSVSLSDDGNTIAIGESHYKIGDARIGRVRVYKYLNSSWTMKGNGANAMIGPSSMNASGAVAGNYQVYLLGKSVKMNNSGTILIAGAPNSRVYLNNNNEVVSTMIGGFVAYKYLSNSDTWVQLGNPIFGRYNYEKAYPELEWGKIVSINNASIESGNLICGMGQTRSGRGFSEPNYSAIYKYSTTSDNWELLGPHIKGGDWMSLVTVGSVTLVTTSTLKSGFSFNGVFNSYIYNKTNNVWNQIGATIEQVNTGLDFCLSSDGYSLVMGSYIYFDNTWAKVPPRDTAHAGMTEFGLVTVYKNNFLTNITGLPSSISKTYEDADLQLTPSSNNTNPFQYSSSNPLVASVSASGKISFLQAGTCTVTVSQDEDVGVSTPASVDIPVTIVAKNLSITVSPSSAKITYSIGGSYQLNPRQNSSDYPGSIVFSTSNSAIATVTETGLINFVKPGYCVITMSLPSVPGKYIGSSATFKLTIDRIEAKITGIPAILEQKYIFGINVSYQLSASSNNSGVPILYSSSNTSIATVDSNGLILFKGIVGQTRISATQQQSDFYTAGLSICNLNIISAESQDTVISGAPSSLTKKYGDDPFPITVTSNNPNHFLYASSDPSVATVDNDGLISYLKKGTTTISISQNSIPNQYTSGNASFSLTVERKITQLSLATSLFNKIYGDKPFTLDIVSNCPLPKIFSSNNVDIASVNNDGLITINNADTDSVEILVEQLQTDQYTYASAKAIINVAKQVTIISAQPVIFAVFGDPSFKLSVISNSNAQMTYNSSNTSVVTIDENGIMSITVVIDPDIRRYMSTITVSQENTRNYTDGLYTGQCEITLPITSSADLTESLESGGSFKVTGSMDIPAADSKLTATSETKLFADEPTIISVT